jgi:penicillin-insensitive murein endopeptidase
VALIRAAAGDPETERVFVHPAIKQALCLHAAGDRAWLTKVRPWWGHDDHIHVRLAGPPGDALCRAQAPPPPGDGCGADLAWWLSEEPWRPKPPGPPPRPVTLADLPAACSAVLGAPSAERVPPGRRGPA